MVSPCICAFFPCSLGVEVVFALTLKNSPLFSTTLSCYMSSDLPCSSPPSLPRVLLSQPRREVYARLILGVEIDFTGIFVSTCPNISVPHWRGRLKAYVFFSPIWLNQSSHWQCTPGRAGGQRQPWVCEVHSGSTSCAWALWHTDNNHSYF